MIGSKSFICFLVVASVGSLGVYGFASKNSRPSSSLAKSAPLDVSPYYSYKSFKKMGVPAIAYSTAAKVFNKIRRVKPKEIVASSPSTNSDNDNTQPKVALVTGSNTGVGFETAKSLALDHGYQVIIACRSQEKGEAACNAINNQIVEQQDGSAAGKAIFLAPLDLSNLDSVREFSEKVTQQYTNIDVLVNNAGKNSGGEPLTDKKLDDLFTTNFLGHFLLTNLLLETCTRIVNLASVMHHFPFYSKDSPYTDISFTDFWRYAAVDDDNNIPVQKDNDESDDKSVRKPYAPSKLAALLFSMELNRRYNNKDGFRSMAVNPGAVNSDIWRNYPSAMKKLFSKIYLTSEQGSSTSVAASVMNFDDSVTYLQPYWLPSSKNEKDIAACPYPIFEMLGPYVAYQPTEPRLPDVTTTQQACGSLFAVCEELAGCKFPAARVGSTVDSQ